MCNHQYSCMPFIVFLELFSILNIYLIDAAPAIFVFGDSLVDVGNNNYIKTLCKSNKKPQGIDFGRPTGRYTNGKTLVDIVGQQIGIKGFIPPYMSPRTKGAVVLNGVNYASGSSGILNSTGKLFIRNINLDAQIGNFANTRRTIISLKGQTGGKKLLRKTSLFVFVIGSNDMLNNYLIPIISIPKQLRFSPKMFVSKLITRFKKQLTRLYQLDARKFVVAELSPIGCIPYVKDVNRIKGPDRCYERANKLARMYNSELTKLVNELKRTLKGSIFVYVNVYHILSDVIRNYKSYGFEKPDSACCRLLGPRGGLFPCNGLSRVCPDRTKYIFWDPFHPTEATNKIVAKRILDGKVSDVWPMNIRQLVRSRTY